MNVFDYLATVTFGSCVPDGRINFDKPAPKHQRDVQKVAISQAHFNDQFGNYHYGGNFDGSDCGELAKRYPGLFRDEIVANFEAGTCNNYPDARFRLALALLQNHISTYYAPRYDDHGEMVFFEGNGFRKAFNEGRSYVYMEDLS